MPTQLPCVMHVVDCRMLRLQKVDSEVELLT